MTDYWDTYDELDGLINLDDPRYSELITKFEFEAVRSIFEELSENERRYFLKAVDYREGKLDQISLERIRSCFAKEIKELEPRSAIIPESARLRILIDLFRDIHAKESPHHRLDNYLFLCDKAVWDKKRIDNAFRAVFSSLLNKK